MDVCVKIIKQEGLKSKANIKLSYKIIHPFLWQIIIGYFCVYFSHFVNFGVLKLFIFTDKDKFHSFFIFSKSSQQF